MSYARSAFGGVVWQFLQIFGERVLQGATFLILARLIGPEEFGIAAINLASVSIFCGVLQGAAQPLIAARDAAPGYLSSFFWLTVGGSLAFAASNVALTAYIMGPNWLALTTVSSIAPFLVAASLVPDVLLTRKMNFRALALRRILGVAISNLLSILLAALNGGAWSLIFQLLCSYFVSGLVSAIAARWRPCLRCSLADWAGIFSASALSGASSGIVQANGRLLEFLVGLLLGAPAAGLFRVARTIVDLITSFAVNPICTVFVALLDRIRREQRDLDRIVNEVYFVAALTVCVSVVCCYEFVPALVRIWFGHAWSGLPGMVALMVLAIPPFSLLLLTNALCTGLHRNGVGLLGTASFLCIGVISVLIGRLWGVQGIVVLLVYSSYLSAFSSFWMSMRLLGLRPQQSARLFGIMAFLTAFSLLISTFVTDLEAFRDRDVVLAFANTTVSILLFSVATRLLMPQSLSGVMDRLHFSPRLQALFIQMLMLSRHRADRSKREGQARGSV